MKFWNYVHTTWSKSLKKQVHPTKLTQMINWHKHSSDVASSLKVTKGKRLSYWDRGYWVEDKLRVQNILMRRDELEYLRWDYVDTVNNILDFDVNNILDTDTFWLIDFSSIKDDYLKKRNMEFFMILDDTKEISLKKFNWMISSDTLIVIDYVVDWKLKDYKTIPLAVLSHLLQIEDKSYELILRQFMVKFWYKIKEELAWKKHYRWLQNAA